MYNLKILNEDHKTCSTNKKCNSVYNIILTYSLRNYKHLNLVTLIRTFKYVVNSA